VARERSPIQKIVQTIVKTVQPERVLLFGSRSKGTSHAGSDYDFMVVVKEIQNERELSRRIYRALLDQRLGVAVDILVVDADKLEHHADQPGFVYHQALTEGKVYYERSAA
jgi:uncharacterized protein